jgi:hypothetical protein
MISSQWKDGLEEKEVIDNFSIVKFTNLPIQELARVGIHVF